MSVTLLRTLTEKSILGFGSKYAEMRVGEIINLQKCPYLRWVYYNCSKISFTPDVLEKISITEADKIEKPGTLPGKEQEIMDRIMARISPAMKSHLQFRAKSAAIERKIRNTRGILRHNTLAKLQRKNHGH